MAIQSSRLATQSPFSQHFQTQSPLGLNLDPIQFGGVTLPKNLIYLDHAAATPVDMRILARMLPWMTQIFGNPANRLHPMGELADYGLAQARQTIAESIGAEFDEVIFCSSATEANNLILRGLIQQPLRKRKRLVVAATEHSSILTTAQELASTQVDLQLLKVDHQGQVDLALAESLIDENTFCVCVMDINNETGIIQKQLQHVIHWAHKKGALVHIDAVQGFARGHFDTRVYQFDSATLSGAKIYAGRGAAALILRKLGGRIRLSPQMTGGGHESGLRSGTPHLAAIIGFAEAVRLQVEERTQRLHYLSHLESIFISSLKGHIAFEYAGTHHNKAPGLLMVHIPRVNAMKLIENMKRVCVSSGSACRTLQATTSHVLKSMGYDDDVALASFRISIGLTNTEAEMHAAAEIVAESALHLQRTSANLAE